MSIHRQVEMLKQQLAQHSSDHAEVERRRWQAKRSLLECQLRSLYYRGSLALRKPAPHYSMWDVAVVTVGPAVAMILTFIVFRILDIPGGLIFWVAVLAAALTFTVLSAMLRYPSTTELPTLIADESKRANELREQSAQFDLEAGTLQKQVVASAAAVRELQQSDQRKRESLLKQNWKLMLDDTWRLFVEEAFTTLGADVEKPDVSAAPGADMVVEFGDMRIAVMTKGNVVAVTSKDVHEIVSAKGKLNCNRAAIITNNRFARSAEELAEANGCYLIGMHDIPAFVMGSNLELFK